MEFDVWAKAAEPCEARNNSIPDLVPPLTGLGNLMNTVAARRLDQMAAAALTPRVRFSLEVAPGLAARAAIAENGLNHGYRHDDCGHRDACDDPPRQS